MRRTTMFLVAFLGSQAFGLAAPYAGKVSALRVDAPEGWSGPTGLVVDDFQDLNSLPPEARQVAEGLKSQVAALGVVAVGDFTYRKKSDPLDQITLRVFVFDSEKSCREWWQKKYRFDGWEKLYSVVEGRHDGLDSKQTTKRIVTFGNVLMTCGSVKKSDEYIKLLDLYVKKARE